MKNKEKMELIADILELEPDEFIPESVLENIEEWDSLAAISYIVMMKEQFGRQVKPEEIRGFKTIQDILNTMQ